MILDDRGTKRPIVGSESRLPGLMDEERRRRLGKHAWKDSARATWDELRHAAPWYILIFPFLAVLFAIPALRALGWSLPLWVSVGLTAAAINAAFGISFLVLRVRTRKDATLYLRAGYCGSCGYDLTGLSPADDGCRVCPECGAAWRLERW